MNSLFNPEHNKEIVERINKLTPQSKAQWGKMNVGQAMAHCQQPLRVAYGDLKLKRTFFGFLLGGMVKKKLTGPADYDKNLPTDKHFIVSDQRNFETEKLKLIALVQKFASEGPKALTKEAHPFFGRLTTAEWDALQYKHLHHHLTQFGV